MRLQKYLSRAGVASRRKSEGLISAGRVRVNGSTVRELGTTVDPREDVVEVDGQVVRPSAARWLLLHKPPGVLTTRKDPGGGRTVYDLLPPDSDDLRYLGRLDRPTEGLLILSNDGDALNALAHPRYEVEREYRVWVKGEPDAATLRRLVAGVQLEDGPARAVRAWRPAGREEGHVCLILTEGRKREVRRLMEAVGHPVTRLRRERFGPVRLGKLPVGAWRELSDEEVDSLKSAGGPGSRR